MVFGRKKEKVVLKETEKDKRARKLVASKDPSSALAAEEPFQQAQSAAIGISRLKHKDQYGNEIADPDRSNPTRHRLERPLDTIRSFDHAIMKEEEEKRLSRYETGTERGGQTAASSRRQSMVRQQFDSYYNGQGRMPRNESFDNARQYRDSNQRLPYNHRGYSNGEQPYYDDSEMPSPSVDTNGTGSGSYASRGWSNDAYSTNPSSESSSYRGRDYMDQNGAPPPVPKKTPSPLSKSQAAYPNQQPQQNGGMNINRKPVPSSSNNRVPTAGYAAQVQGQEGYYYDDSGCNDSYGNPGSQEYYNVVSPVSPVDGQQNGFGGRPQQQQYQQNVNPYGQRNQQQQGGYYQQQQQPQKQQQYRQQQPQYNYNPAAVQDNSQRRPNTLSKQNSSSSQTQSNRGSWLKRTFSRKDNR